MTSFAHTFDTRRMSSSNEREVHPPKPVEVLIDDEHWRPGQLDRWSWEAVDNAWFGRVRLGLNGHTKWYRQDRIRKAPGYKSSGG